MFHRTRHQLTAILFACSAFATGCSTSADPDTSQPQEEALEPIALEQLASAWSDTFAAAIGDGPVALGEAARAYLSSVSSIDAIQIADLLNSNVFTHDGMREALARALNSLGRFDESLNELAKLEHSMVPSKLAYLRALGLAQIDLRSGVMVQDDAKRAALLEQLILLQPTVPDAGSLTYAYNLGTAMFVSGRTSEALAQFLPLLGEETAPQPSTIDLDLLGSAMNMSVTAFKAQGDLIGAQQMLERLIRFDDLHQLNYSGRNGQDTNPHDIH